jgi:hypothetical protein
MNEETFLFEHDETVNRHPPLNPLLNINTLYHDKHIQHLQ